MTLIILVTPCGYAGGECIVVAGFETGAMEGGIPTGWELQRSKGTPDMTLEEENGHHVLHLKSDNESSYGISREVTIDPNTHHFLRWRWKAVTLPAGADVRKKETDDQAIQLYVAFEPTGWPKKLNIPLIGYIWDTEAPTGIDVASSQLFAGKVRYMVLRNKEDALNRWYSEERDLVADYKRLFPDIDGGRLRRIEGFSIYINAQNTGTAAEGFIADIRVCAEPAGTGDEKPVVEEDRQTR